MKILVVEDHLRLAEITCNLLREVHEHEVAHASTGAAALRAMGTFEPDLVLLDINLPDLTGYDVAAQVRADAAWDEVVLVALTGFGRDVDLERARTAGIDAHFRKPMDLDLLPEIRRKS